MAVLTREGGFCTDSTGFQPHVDTRGTRVQPRVHAVLM